MNPTVKKWTALLLCTALCLSGVCLTAVRAEDQTIAASPASVPVTSAPRTGAEDAAASLKDETVYVLTQSNGTVQSIIVSDWLQNTAGADVLFDSSLLTDVENVKGEESCTREGEHQTRWYAQGNDIYYQGRTEQALPVTMQVRYLLDGEELTPEALAGKSGHVTIRFDYESCLYETVALEDGEETLPVPFAVVTGLLLDNDTFRNVEITHGRLVNDGVRTLALGVAFPGLQEDLSLSPDTLSIPDFVELQADVTDFSLGMTLSVASSQVLAQLDGDKLTLDGDLSQSLEQLNDAMAQLPEGSSGLYDGLCTLLERSGALTEGVQQLTAGTKALQTGADTLESGTAQLYGGLVQLSSGLDGLSANSDQLNLGAQQLMQGLLLSANQQLQEAGLALPTLTADNYAQVLEGAAASLNAADAVSAAETVTALKVSLDSCQSFCQGLLTYTGGVDAAAAGAGSLVSGGQALTSGSAQLSQGASALYDGARTLEGSLPALTEGITQLRDGALALSDGLCQLDEQGLQRLNQQLKGLSERLKATVELSRQYCNFSGLDASMEGQVRFLYRTAEIPAQ